MIPQSFFAQQASRLDLFFMKFPDTQLLGTQFSFALRLVGGDMTKMGD